MNALRELRLALRNLMRTPGFFALALVTLSLGIASATVLFSITESVLWRPFSFPDSERLVSLLEFNPKIDPLGSLVSAPNFRDWRELTHGFDGLAAMTFGESHSLTGAGERVRSNSVSAGFFETLRVSPSIGRTFHADDEQTGRSVVLTDAFRLRQFGANADILGRQIVLDGEPYTVIGAMPAGFRLEFLAGTVAPDLFLPLPLRDPKWKRAQRNLVSIGRLKRSVSLNQADQELSAAASRMAAEHPEDSGWTARVVNLRVRATQSEGRTLLLFLGFSCLVLLIACVNVAGLQLVRFTGRRREYALRLALGAGRGALLRQALAENAWIAIPGAGAGALLALWGISGVRTVLPAGLLARSTDIVIDVASLAFVLALSLMATLIFALAPVLFARKLDLDGSLRSGARGGATDRGTRRRLDLLIACEVALAFVLLFSAGLFVSSYSRLLSAPLGFDPHNVLAMRIAPGGNPGITPADRREFFGRLLTKAQAVPGVERAALAGGLPLDFPAGIKLAQGDGSLNSLARVITPEYFRILSMSLLRGRAFSDADAADRPRVAIVNENLARALFGDQNPVGRRLTLIADAGAAIPAGSLEIVGLARNVKELGIDEIPFNDVYLPFAQNPPRSMYVVMKTSGAAVAAKGVLRAELHALDADGVLSDAATMEERIHDGLRGARFHLAMAAIFATLAVLLAAVGVYGAVAFSTAQRTGEFALRMALGARPSSLLRLMFSHTVRLTGAGALAGMGVALILGELLKSALYLAPHLHSGLIYGVAVHDPLLLGGAVALLLAIAALAALVPAARAMRIDPCQALRQE